MPLILAGDEFGNSQGGNNNAYCQDNRTGWVNWKQLEKNQEYFRDVKELLAFRKEHPCIRSRFPLQMKDYQSLGMPDLSYHSTQAWNSEIYPSMQTVGEVYSGAYHNEEGDLYIGWNFSPDWISLALPQTVSEKEWRISFGNGVISENRDQLQIDGCSVALLVTAPREVKKRAGAQTVKVVQAAVRDRRRSRKAEPETDRG